jgi:hypothetical protein
MRRDHLHQPEPTGPEQTTEPSTRRNLSSTEGCEGIVDGRFELRLKPGSNCNVSVFRRAEVVSIGIVKAGNEIL